MTTLTSDVEYRGSMDVLTYYEPVIVARRADSCECRSFEMLRHYRLHADILTWGYRGKGPRDTARCILIDYLDLLPDKDRNFPEIDGIYRLFTDDFIAKLPNEPKTEWVIKGDDIARWLEAHPPINGRKIITQR